VVTELRLVDGATLRIDGVGPVASPVSSQALFALGDGRTQLLRGQPPGFSRDLEGWHARGDFAHPHREYVVHQRRERPWRDGVLRVADVSHQTPLGVRRRLALAFFEHTRACLAMARAGRGIDEAEQLFDLLPLDTAPGGVSVRLPVVADVRPPAALTYIPRLGQLVINPLTAPVLRQLPARPGRRVAHGELYRASEASRAVLFITDTCRVLITPEPRSVDLALAAQLAVEWVKN
jgi:hypothetical protein